MRRSFLFALLGLASFASTARAKCDDTLYLQSLTVYRQSLVNTATLGKWDSTIVGAFDSTNMAKAGPISFAPYQQDYSYPTSDVNHYTKLSSNCGTDSVSPVDYWRVVDTVQKISPIKEAHAVAVSSGTRSLMVQRLANRIFSTGGVSYPVDYLWTSDEFDIGLPKNSDTVQAWSYSYLGFRFHKPDQAGSILSSDLPWSLSPPKPFSQMVDNHIASGLAVVKGWVDSIGKGVIDSTRLEIARFKYTYGFSKPVGVRSMRQRSAAFKVRASAEGWSVSLPVAAAVRVVDLDGRVARQIPSGQNLIWDGRDASGAKVHPGIWLIHAQGVGTTSVLVR